MKNTRGHEARLDSWISKETRVDGGLGAQVSSEGGGVQHRRAGSRRRRTTTGEPDDHPEEEWCDVSCLVGLRGGGLGDDGDVRGRGDPAARGALVGLAVWRLGDDVGSGHRDRVERRARRRHARRDGGAGVAVDDDQQLARVLGGRGEQDEQQDVEHELRRLEVHHRVHRPRGLHERAEHVDPTERVEVAPLAAVAAHRAARVARLDAADAEPHEVVREGDPEHKVQDRDVSPREHGADEADEFEKEGEREVGHRELEDDLGESVDLGVFEAVEAARDDEGRGVVDR
mmetsp:Transcript_624/g.2466  ORF Transcript_624/g.2466 Transcript_624/m.2466 type:complete len:287 (-) Transcript_624:391-1251(-)